MLCCHFGHEYSILYNVIKVWDWYGRYNDYGPGKKNKERKKILKNQKDTADQMSSPWIITTVVRPAGGHHTCSGRVSLRHIL